MGLLSRIFGTDEAIKSTIDTVSKGLDALVYTDEEKAGDAAKDRSEARRMVVEWMNATQGQNLSRRFLAITIACTWMFQYLAAMLLNVAAIWFDNVDKIQASAAVISSYGERMNGAVMLILAFYFAAPHMGQIVGPALQRFGNK